MRFSKKMLKFYFQSNSGKSQMQKKEVKNNNEQIKGCDLVLGGLKASAFSFFLASD